MSYNISDIETNIEIIQLWQYNKFFLLTGSRFNHQMTFHRYHAVPCAILLNTIYFSSDRHFSLNDRHRSTHLTFSINTIIIMFCEDYNQWIYKFQRSLHYAELEIRSKVFFIKNTQL